MSLDDRGVALVRLPFDYGGTTDGGAPHPRDLMWPAPLLYCAALLRRAGFSPTVTDLHPFREDPVRLARRLADQAPATLILDVATPDVPYCLEFAQQVRQRLPDVRIWATGQHPSYSADVLLGEKTAIDACLQGELLGSVVALAEGRPANEIPGAVVRGEEPTPGRVVEIVPDDLPPLQVDGLDLDAYRLNSVHVPRLRPVRWGFLQTSWGCPFDCLFCSQTLRASYSRRWRGLSAERVVDDMERLNRDHGLDAFYFMDDITSFDRQRLLDIAERVQRRNLDLHWVIQTRSDYLDEAMLRPLRKGGCVGIKFGVESGDPALLERVGKRLSLDHTVAMADAIRREGIALTSYYMLGFPGETLEQMESTFRIAKRIGSEMIQVAVYTPYPTSRGFDEFPAEVREDLLANPQRFSHYNTALPINLSAVGDEELMEFHRNFYLHYYLAPRQVARYLRRRAVYTFPQGTDLGLIRTTLGYLTRRRAPTAATPGCS